MDGVPVDLRIAGQSVRVVASAEPQTLEKLAQVVDAKVSKLSRGAPSAQQALVLAAISLAHDLEEERARRLQVEARSREMLRSLLARVDAALESVDEDGNELHGSPAASPDA